MAAEYINIDLEIFSQTDLSPLRDAFGDRAFVMYCGETKPGEYLLSIEINGDEEYVESGSDIQKTANALCQLVENLDEPGKKLWNAATHRTFDVGLEATDDQAAKPTLNAETLLRIGKLNAQLDLTVYTSKQALVNGESG